MKQKIRNICILLVLSMAMLLGACSNKEPSKSLYEQGLEIVSLMQEMASNEEYITFLSAGADLKSILLKTAEGDFSQPKAVYQVKVSESAFFELSELDINALSEPLQENLGTRVNLAVFNQINALGGMEELAAASVCTAGKTFVSNELTENMIYLYVYENAVPVAISFTKGENGAVSASGNFVLYDGFHTDSKSDIEQFMAEFNAQIEEVAI